MKFLNWKNLKIASLFKMAKSKTEKIDDVINSITLFFQIIAHNLECGDYSGAHKALEDRESFRKLIDSNFTSDLTLDQRFVMLSTLTRLEKKFEEVGTLRTPVILTDLVYHYLVYILEHDRTNLMPFEITNLEQRRQKYEH